MVDFVVMTEQYIMAAVYRGASCSPLWLWASKKRVEIAIPFRIPFNGTPQ
jgi:hypothetical protein